MNPTIAARYGARLLALVLTWALGVLGATGAHFSNLGREGALLALAIILGAWALHVAGDFASTGKVPEIPAEALAIHGELLSASPTPVTINNYGMQPTVAPTPPMPPAVVEPTRPASSPVGRLAELPPMPSAHG